MRIIAYRKYNDVDVYFEEYNWIAKNRQYIDFQKGEIKCPYERRVYNVGFIGEGKYKPNKSSWLKFSFKERQELLKKIVKEIV